MIPQFHFSGLSQTYIVCLVWCMALIHNLSWFAVMATVLPSCCACGLPIGIIYQLTTMGTEYRTKRVQASSSIVFLTFLEKYCYNEQQLDKLFNGRGTIITTHFQLPLHFDASEPEESYHCCYRFSFPCCGSNARSLHLLELQKVGYYGKNHQPNP